MIQGTTPAHVLRIRGYDLTDKSVYVTFSSGYKTITKTGSDVRVTYNGEASIISVLLSQEDTLALEVGEAKVQVRFIGSDNVAQATKTAPVKVEGALLKKVIEYDRT